MVFKTSITFLAQKRIPMIKFRKGGNVISSTASQPQSVSTPENQSKPKTASASGSNAGKTCTSVEYWQLHPRFQRRPIDEFECEYINRGGPDKL